MTCCLFVTLESLLTHAHACAHQLTAGMQHECFLLLVTDRHGHTALAHACLEQSHSHNREMTCMSTAHGGHGHDTHHGRAGLLMMHRHAVL